MRHFLLLNLLLLAGLATAQRPPLPGIPRTPPPVPHPGLVGQPLFGEDTPSSGGSSGKAKGKPAAQPAPDPMAEPIDPATLKVQLHGRDLEAAVAKVLALDWLEDLEAAKARAAATGKPIFWLQALGDLDGYACSTLQSLRGLSLPDEKVRSLLAEQFVLGYRDIETVAHVGLSDGYKPYHSALETTNGAGGRNLQMLVLAADGTVLHALPGYWDPRDLAAELDLALQLHRLHGDTKRSRRAKVAMYEALHRAFVERIPADTRKRSRWQQDDARQEAARSEKKRRDTLVLDDKGKPIRLPSGHLKLKPLCDLVHERLVIRPFRPLDEFAIESFVDYGQPRHDLNAPHDTGKKFRRARWINEQRAKGK